MESKKKICDARDRRNKEDDECSLSSIVGAGIRNQSCTESEGLGVVGAGVFLLL